MRFALACVLVGCSRPAPVAPDPATSAIDANVPKPIAAVDAGAPAERYFMDTSDGDKDCYRDIWCKVTGPTCAPKARGDLDAKWTAKLRAESPAAAWCCYKSTICEYPAEK